ncbi:2,3-diphosphoglycerate-dependent phosphoglycerate mutase [uncultured Dubosiella sp.]|jgi:2,3-bisphosphoglycerate-dependent phosphoglycerate mutase|uniref:2,3-diphosphoglycerate-dependent phosphoglycerate mutase n=1 Tax=uncultured Dubosiella sp. TaxID=1937011 RepID=UPI00208B9BB5|nr:2,3-diphosphoglycerate-dependent phosphoglycerate mutase [uncultured Dubosiella sp.]GJM58980.1 2,3-bisphosphoglycerate-dependent phosphoglycerate mutase [Erysipelotrichaceae bacterium OPF54]GJM59096.1 2,3-bisphosphoglycerate-dependent phosphoglycerate mutase [Erysipelotrichaceae bacterium OPF54]
MKQLVCVRHGESEWNKKNLFTGWSDVDLSEHGHQEAIQAGKILFDKGYFFDIAYTSMLKRAIHTLDHILDGLDQVYVPVIKAWQLNERHYGALQGLNKAETAARYGDEQVLLWRRSFDVLPPLMEEDDPHAPRNEKMYRTIPKDKLPLGESLKTTIERVIPFYEQEIRPHIEGGENVLITAHGNSLRALLMYLAHISKEEIMNINIPTGVPLVFEFDDSMQFIRSYYLLDQKELEKKMEAVASQGKAVHKP